MRLPPGYRSRPAEHPDLDAIVALFTATDLADAGLDEPVRDHLEDEWRSSTFDAGRDTRLVVAGDGKVAAFAKVTGFNPALSLEAHARIHPSHRGRGLGEAIVAWAEPHALERSPRLPKLYVDAPAGDDAARDLFERHGFVWVRAFWHMERDLGGEIEAAVVPEGIEIRSYRHDDDVRPLHDALEEAFADHWGFEPYPYEDHVDEMARADPGLIAVATAGGEVAGGSVCRMLEGVAWVGVLGVRRAWRGRGIARALLLRTFAAAAERGAPTARLSVDAENTTGATRLYESVGMRVRRAWDVFEKRYGPD